MKKTIYLGVCGVCCMALLAGCDKSEKQKDAAPAKTAPKMMVPVGQSIQLEDLESRRYTGLVVSPAVVKVVPRVSGEILEVGFADGSKVEAGQMLYKLDDVSYAAAVKSSEAKIAECEARLTYAEKEYERSVSLFEKNAASLDKMESNLSSVQAYKAELLSAKANLITAQDNYKDTVITSPITGMAGVSAYTVGNYLTPSAGVLVTVIQTNPVRVKFSLSTADYLSLFGSLEALQNDGDIQLKLSDGSYYQEAGKIAFLNNEANSKTDAIQIYAEFPNPDNKLIVGSTVSVTLAKKLGQKMVAVPLPAVQHDRDGEFVFVVDQNNIPEKRYVEVGNSTVEYQMIRSGLEVGETVVIGGTHKVTAGAEIIPTQTGK